MRICVSRHPDDALVTADDVRRPRVIAVDVDPARERDPAVYDEQLAMIARVDVERVLILARDPAD